MPVKPLSFKGDKKHSKKRKHRPDDETLPSDPNKALTAIESTDDPTAEDETWTTPDKPTDLTGPVLLILPTQPRTCLASDAHGNVFASALENIVENVPETGEPHDVRQVWVATAVAGTVELSFKGSHGGYLSCDSLGILGARREARGAEEGFVVEQVGEAEGQEKERWKVRTAASKKEDGEKGQRYLCAVTETKTGAKAVNISLRGDGEAESASTNFIVKMQARFKPRVQQNKETKAKEKVSRKELEQAVGRRLEDDEVKRLKRARKEGNFYEEVLDVRVKGKHDKFAS
jgi:protein FRG1